MGQDNNISIIPIQEYRFPKEGKRAVQYAVDLSVTPFISVVDLVNIAMRGQISQIPTLYYDNADNAFAVTIVMEGTLQRIICPANTQGYVRLLLPQKPRLGFSAPQSCQFKVNFLNWAVEEVFIWGASAVSGGTVTSVGLSLPAEFTVTGSPVTTAGTLTGSWAAQMANKLFAGPVTGAAATPSFRTLVTADLNSIAGQIPGEPSNGNAAAGNVGEYLESNIAIGVAVAAASGVTADITSLLLSPGDWDIEGNIGFIPATTTQMTNASGWVSTVSATNPVATNIGGFCDASIAYTSNGTALVLATGRKRVSVSVNTTVYLSYRTDFTVSTNKVFGNLRARRMR